MGSYAVLSSHRLDKGLVLAPERYDPRRRALSGFAMSVGDIADVSSEQVSVRSAENGKRYVVFNTGDAQKGVVVSRPVPVNSSDIGSSKKLVRVGDLLISRLRPYLRQVAFVDAGLGSLIYPESVLLCSTEFYVLRPKEGESIAFLVPFLLSNVVQEILCVAQEGGHHPRFNQRTLENLGLPESFVALREQISESVKLALAKARESDATLRQLISGMKIHGA